MTLEELGEEYLKQYEQIKNHIKKLKSAENGLTRKQQLKLHSRLLALYTDAAALRVTGEHLINYYGNAK